MRNFIRPWVAIAIIALLVYFGWMPKRTTSEDAVSRLPAIKTLPEIVAKVQEKHFPESPTQREVQQKSKVPIENFDLQQILRSKDYCALIRMMDQALNYAELGEYLLGNKDLVLHSDDENASFENIFREGHGSFSNSLGQRTTALKFFSALLYGDLFDGLSSSEVDLYQAEILLTELEREDPQNGAFPYFLIRKRLDTRPELLRPALEFGKRLMNPGIELGSKKDEFIYWSALEHVIGNKLYLKAWSLLYPNQHADPKYSTPYQTLLKAKEESDKQRFHYDNELFQQISQSADYCPKEQIEGIFNSKQIEFLKFSQRREN